MVRVLTYTQEKGLEEPGIESIPELLKDEKRLTWVDFDNPGESETELLSSVFKFHPLAIEDCLSFVPNPKIDDYSDYLYIVIHGISSEALKRDELETHDLDIFLGKNYLVTFHKDYSRSVASVMERCRKNTSLMAKESEWLMHKVVDTLVDNYLPIMDELEEKIDATEKESFEKPGKEIPKKILALKKDILYLRRVIHPQREILRQLSSGEYPIICFDCSLHFKDVYDHLFMISELIESYRDSLTTAMDVYLSTVSNRLNEVMKVLTVIATIMMPLTLISGIYGMNFRWMPLLDEPFGFHVMIIIMLFLGGGMLWSFKRRGWW
ncbi:MAG: magnesium/cobalt transporter CorA [Deltaproteobacteria bacterium]|nr:magnesium/cobalt transporter CorA [Deltaproteobacteria bacterium]